MYRGRKRYVCTCILYAQRLVKAIVGEVCNVRMYIRLCIAVQHTFVHSCSTYVCAYVAVQHTFVHM